jgi:sugar/nucleoside kinase (ribokinase family)
MVTVTHQECQGLANSLKVEQIVLTNEREMDVETTASGSTADGRELDVFLSGLLFADVVMTGLDQPPTPGVEVWSSGGGVSPGGIANVAVTCRRLGLSTALATVAGRDTLGRYCWETLSVGEGIDLSRSRQVAGWRTPVTVSLAYAGDRALVTCGDEPPLTQDALIGQPPISSAAFVHLGAEPHAWVETAHQRGTLVFADVGWDPTGRWNPEVLDQLQSCHAFLPNEAEAMAYTRTDDAHAALSALAGLVPLAVVTCGTSGALAVDATTGERASVPGVTVRAIDATGAGDAFGAAIIVGTLGGWPLSERLRFAALVAGLSVQGHGGAASAPTWADLSGWLSSVRSRGDMADVARAYQFLDDIIPPAGQAGGGLQSPSQRKVGGTRGHFT